MKLYVFLQFSLLFVLAAAGPLKCPDEQIFDKNTNNCEDRKCPREYSYRRNQAVIIYIFLPTKVGQIWLEDSKSCGKFGKIESGSYDDIIKEDSHGHKSCQGDFIWVPSLQICAQKPRICKNAACTEKKVHKSAEDCPENKPWNENHKKCERPKHVESKF